jgi:hypothetical protein
MKKIAAERELFRACEIIFGPELHISREFLEYLQLSGIKSAYRRRALETHPDRAAMADEHNKRQRHDLFHSVHQAYENLLTFLDAREKGLVLFSAARPPRPAPSQAGRSRRFSSWNAEGLYQGPLPNRRLLLGHFLYYSGLINWRTIIQALVWQRTQRPRLGELAIRFGLFAEKDILHILRNQPPQTPFGQTALALGLLSESQLQFLLLHQKWLKKKIGRFFLEKKILTPEELLELLNRCRAHNTTIARRMAGAKIRF